MAWVLEMTPSLTESMTARATAACAGPNICTACLAPLMVTLLKSSVSGLQGRFGRDDGEQRGEAVGVTGERLREGGAGRSGLRPDDQIDVRDLVAVADERFTDEEIRGHTCLRVRFGEERKDLPKHTQLDLGEE